MVTKFRDTRPIMVAIQCITYNHEPYIRQCLNSFVTQKTNFHFVAIVHDDASTDGTANIIREYAKDYPDIIKPIYETENQFSKRDGSLERIVRTAIDSTKCKYVATCEGDDFWTDSFKLQKQVDILEANDKIALVHSNFEYLIENTQKLYIDQKQNEYNIKNAQKKRKELMTDILDMRYRITTPTVLYRLSAKKQLLDLKVFQTNFLMSDTQLWVGMASLGDIHYIPTPMAVYRKHEGSSTVAINSRDQFFFKLQVAEMRLLTSYGFEELSDLITENRILLIKNLRKYLIFNPNYTSTTCSLIKSEIKHDFLTNTIKNNKILRWIILRYYDIKDTSRNLYRWAKKLIYSRIINHIS